MDTAVNMKPDMKLVKEGAAEVYFPQSVFYNPVQEFNRDLTIAVIRQHVKEHFVALRDRKQPVGGASAKEDFVAIRDIKQPVGGASVTEEDNGKTLALQPLELGQKYEGGIRILEALSASGLRSMRFAKEIAGIRQIMTNDYSENAFNMIKMNAAYNKVEHLVTPSHADGSVLMYQHRKYADRFDVVDLDPYGSAAPFLDAAVQAVKDGGLLCVTCTDTAVLCGNATETCHSKYGSVTVRIKSCHEMALRILLRSIESHANRYSRYIVPLLSMSADFYVRVFMKVYTGQGKVKQSFSKLALLYHCSGCGTFHTNRLGTCTPTKGGNLKYGPATVPPIGPHCEHCNRVNHVGGPIWADRLHNNEFLESVIKGVEEDVAKLTTSQRILGMLTVMKEELPDVPLYYVIDSLVNVLHCVAPSMLQIRSAILHAGYEVSYSHANKNSIKTKAPPDVLWDIMRAWVKDHPINEKRLIQSSPGIAILSKTSATEVSFELRADANPDSRQKGLKRFQTNPEKDWGPGARAKSATTTCPNDVPKSKRLQGKRRKERATPDLKQFDCKKFKDGTCDLGDECRYSHK